MFVETLDEIRNVITGEPKSAEITKKVFYVTVKSRQKVSLSQQRRLKISQPKIEPNRGKNKLFNDSIDVWFSNVICGFLGTKSVER